MEEVDFSVAYLEKKKEKRKTRKRKTKSQRVGASIYTFQLYDFHYSIIAENNINFPRTNNGLV